jgi:monoamine oxidase
MTASDLRSKEGFQWTESTGLQAGIPCVGTIDPPHSITNNEHDVIVLGAGYAGLTAARDLATTGHSVLLVEARDRIGGRTWSSNIDGYPFELGGTWVHWNQPLVYREISRYNLHKQLEVSPASGFGIDTFHLTRPSGTTVMNHEEEVSKLPRRTRITLISCRLSFEDLLGASSSMWMACTEGRLFHFHTMLCSTRKSSNTTECHSPIESPRSGMT